MMTGYLHTNEQLLFGNRTNLKGRTQRRKMKAASLSITELVAAATRGKETIALWERFKRAVKYFMFLRP